MEINKTINMLLSKYVVSANVNLQNTWFASKLHIDRKREGHKRV